MRQNTSFFFLPFPLSFYPSSVPNAADPDSLVLVVVVLPLAQLLVVHQVSERLRGDGHHVGKDEAAVAAGRQHQLVVAVVVADAPHPATGEESGRSTLAVVLTFVTEVEEQT